MKNHQPARGSASMFFRLFLCATIAAMATTSDVGIGQLASISGRVVDAAGWPVPGVFVTITEESGENPTRATTGRDGTYEFPALIEGTYRIDFELAGFDTMRRSHVRVRPGASAVGDATMYVSALCECVDVRSATTLRERPGLVTDEFGRPVARARLQIVSPAHSELAYTDSEGRFRVRVAVNENWPLTASASGFIAVTQQVSGAVEDPIVFKLRRSGTPLPDIERFYRVCCPGDLFTR